VREGAFSVPVDVSEDVAARLFEMSTTAAHFPAFAIVQPVSPVAAAGLSRSAEPPASAADPLVANVLSRHVSITRSPALTSLRRAVAWLSTGSVRLSSALVAGADALGAGLRTVIVLAVSSVITTTALIFAEARADEVVVVDCDAGCFTSISPCDEADAPMSADPEARPGLADEPLERAPEDVVEEVWLLAAAFAIATTLVQLSRSTKTDALPNVLPLEEALDASRQDSVTLSPVWIVRRLATALVSTFRVRAVMPAVPRTVIVCVLGSAAMTS
jgi:hypothetical protein